jgi:hypothetical protein
MRHVKLYEEFNEEASAADQTNVQSALRAIPPIVALLVIGVLIYLEYFA